MEKHQEQSKSHDQHHSGDANRQLLSQTLNQHPKQHARAENNDKAPSYGHPKPAAANPEQEKKDLLNKYGVERSVEDGMVRYRLPGDSDHKVLFEAKPGAAESAQSKQKLDQLVQGKLHDIYDKFHVTFGKEGEDAVRPWVASKTDSTKLVKGEMMHSRVPRLSELMGVEAALYSSQPSQFTNDKTHEALKFYFLKKPMFGASTYDAGIYASDEKKKMSVFIEPDTQPERPITVSDAVKRHDDIKASVEALAAHEIAHNSERNVGTWNIPKFLPVAERLGWTTNNDTNYWMLKGKNGDLYRLTNDGLSNDKGWIRCDTKGGALDEQGKPVTDEKNAPHFTNKQVRNDAMVKPPTDYFTAPDEMLADSLMLYRVGEEGRKQLLKSGQDLYDVVKEFDQAEIDQRFGKTAEGVSKKMRLDDGRIGDYVAPQIATEPSPPGA